MKPFAIVNPCQQCRQVKDANSIFSGRYYCETLKLKMNSVVYCDEPCTKLDFETCEFKND